MDTTPTLPHASATDTPAGTRPPTPPMPPFSGAHPICEKCGHDEAHSTYYTSGMCVHSNDNYIMDTHQGTPNPRMHRSCKECGYSWDERPLDATPRP